MKSTIETLAAKLRSGDCTSVSLTEEYIRAIEASDINAYVHRSFALAREQAKRADEMLAAGKGTLLTGIPMALKDNICTKGEETTCCSKILHGYVPFFDATAWEKLKEQGAVLLGKNNMDEFAMGSTSETSCYGAPLNPWNKTRVTGGSSGGGAAAVAGHLAAYALGSDTGGSIRQPASFCGIVGLKPTYGAVSRYGLIAYGSSLDQIGPMGNSVKDVAIVFDAIKGEDARDATSEQTFGTVADRLEGGVNGLRIGVAEEYFDGLGAEMREKFDAAIELFARLGAKIVRLSVPGIKLALPAYYIIACAEASSNLGRYDGIRFGYRAEKYDSVDDMICKTRTEGFGKEVQRRIMLGTYVLSAGYYDAYYKKACKLRAGITASFAEAFASCDVLLAPTVPNTAFPLGYTGKNRIEMYLSDICTVPVNIAGLPAVSLPCGKDADGMPVGMQLIGRKFDEETILRAAYAYENCAEPVGEAEGGVRV